MWYNYQVKSYHNLQKVSRRKSVHFPNIDKCSECPDVEPQVGFPCNGGAVLWSIGPAQVRTFLGSTKRTINNYYNQY